jgi:hypothetical protein
LFVGHGGNELDDAAQSLRAYAVPDGATLVRVLDVMATARPVGIAAVAHTFRSAWRTRPLQGRLEQAALARQLARKLAMLPDAFPRDDDPAARAAAAMLAEELESAARALLSEGEQ